MLDGLSVVALCLLNLVVDELMRNQFRTDIIIRDLEEARRENLSERELQINTDLLFHLRSSETSANTDGVSLRENSSKTDFLLHTDFALSEREPTSQDAVEVYILGRNVRNTMIETR